jgi:adenylyl cyclase-associated protein
VQVVEKVPTVSIDKTDGCQLYLSKDSLETEIVTAKSSEMNVLIPKGEEGDFTEMAMPEQYKTTIKDGALVTEPTDIAG